MFRVYVMGDLGIESLVLFACHFAILTSYGPVYETSSCGIYLQHSFNMGSYSAFSLHHSSTAYKLKSIFS